MFRLTVAGPGAADGRERSLTIGRVTLLDLVGVPLA
jgi:hypothetical protein